MAREWREEKLGDLITLVSGGTPSKGVAEYWGGDVPWISAKDMKSFWIEDSEDHLTEDGARRATKMVEAGTTLMLVRGMTLHHDVPICKTTRASTFNQDVKAVSPKKEIINDYLTYLLLGHKARILSEVDLAGHGTGRINTDLLLAMPVVIPDKREQRFIADILGALDDKIALNQRMNRTLEGMARALFKEWFVDFGPVRAKAEVRRQHPRWTNEQVNRAALPNMDLMIAKEFPDAVRTFKGKQFPEKWDIRPLDRIGFFLNGLALQKYPPIGKKTLPAIKIAQLRRGRSDGADLVSSDLPPEYIISNNDILFSWSGTLDCVIWHGGPGALNQHLFKVTSRSGEDLLIYLWIHHHLQEFRAIAAGKATTMGHIQRHHLSDAKVVVPSESFAKLTRPIFDSLWEEMIHCGNEIAYLENIRDNLLPKLISGELRIKDAERLIGKAV